MANPASLKKRQEWKDKILKQKASGKTIESWCRENSIAPHLFHYWKKQFFSEAFNRSGFTELGDRNAGVAIECKGVVVHLERSFDPAVLKSCLSILRTGKC
ncbi:MAG: hypothetical protein WC371_03280 [Parachlamydiales bacterium]|jgi:transposase-like protein